MQDIVHEAGHVPRQQPIPIAGADVDPQVFASVHSLPWASLDKPASLSSKNKPNLSRKARRRSDIAAYVLQLIGLFCLMLAAIKSFEPLTGVGFTLIMIGYNKQTGTSMSSVLSGKDKRRKKKDKAKRDMLRLKRKSKRKTREDDTSEVA